MPPTDRDANLDPVPFIDLGAQYRRLKADIDTAIAGVLEDGRFVLGPAVAELEAALAARAGAAHAVTCASGTDALLIALMAEGIGPGDAVFVPGFTFPATAGVVALVGAAPVFVDVAEESCMMDPADLAVRAARVADEGRLVPRAVIAADLFGQAADYDALAPIAAERGMLLVDDAAQSFGGASGGRPVGALAPVTATSFYPAKPLGGYGDGGALFTDDAAQAARWRSIRQHGQGDGKYDIVRVGLNSRLDTLQAAVLLAKLPAFDAEIDARERVAALYDSLLAGDRRAAGSAARASLHLGAVHDPAGSTRRGPGGAGSAGDPDRDPLSGADAPAAGLPRLGRGVRLAAGQRAAESPGALPAHARRPRRADGHANRPRRAGRGRRLTARRWEAKGRTASSLVRPA